MSRGLKFRLSLMMFLEWFVPGAITPVLSHYLRNYLHLEPFQIGLTLSVPAIAAMVAPFVAARTADRWMGAERCLALCHFVAAGVMLLLWRQTSFVAFAGLYFLYSFLFMPTYALVNTVTFHHCADAKRDYGAIRLWGTLGWFAVAWVFYLYLTASGDLAGQRLRAALPMSALSSLALGFYALTLPRSPAMQHVPLVTSNQPRLSFWERISPLRQPSLLALCALAFLNSIGSQFYYYAAGPYLVRMGFAEQHILPLMSMGQLCEAAVMGLLGFFLARLGIKRALMIGAFVQAARFFAFASAGPTALILLGIGVHGFCYTLFYGTAFVYVDTHCSRNTRAGTQQLFNLIMAGFGNFSGSLIAGATGQWCAASGSSQIDYSAFWLVPGILGIAITILIALFFREEKPTALSR